MGPPISHSPAHLGLVFAGIGAVASQLAPTCRIAIELGGAVIALFFLLRVIADTASGAGWLRWATPLGWAEEPVSLYACAQLGAARHEEADQQLETLLALPVSRAGWLGGRLLLAACAAAAISLVAGMLTWAAAESGGVSISLPRMLEAGANCLPVAFLLLGIAALAYAVVPRASGGIAYGLVTVTFLWQLFGSLLGAPKWLVNLTPFAHVGLVPAQPFRAGAAAVMLAIGFVAALTALRLFRRRDLLAA